MEHDPLCGRGNAVVALVKGRELGQDGVVVVRHAGVVLVWAVEKLDVEMLTSRTGLGSKWLAPGAGWCARGRESIDDVCRWGR